MSFRRLFPRVLTAFCALSLSALSAAAQTAATRPRVAGEPASTTTTTTQADGRARLENDLRVISTAEESEAEPSEVAAPSPSFVRGMGSVERVLLGEIEERLGTPYRMGSEGPTRYDCSGFVWSVFQSAGIGFERGSARTFWSQFEPVGEGDQYKFGTLVFFNGLRHVGIVADAEGFYHASSSKGVVYSRFGEYWSKRVTGFRRVPLAAGRTFIASAGR